MQARTSSRVRLGYSLRSSSTDSPDASRSSTRGRGELDLMPFRQTTGGSHRRCSFGQYNGDTKRRSEIAPRSLGPRRRGRRRDCGRRHQGMWHTIEPPGSGCCQWDQTDTLEESAMHRLATVYQCEVEKGEIGTPDTLRHPPETRRPTGLARRLIYHQAGRIVGKGKA